LNKIKGSNASDLNELKLHSPSSVESSKLLSDFNVKRPTESLLNELKPLPSDALKNITPRNFLLEQKNATRKEMKQFEKPSLNAINPYITDNISKLMKKYSIY
jgi:hypothetical protein